MVNAIAIWLAAYISVFLEVTVQSVRHLTGAQVDLLPALMVYASLNAGLGVIALTAVLGGMLFDSFSANPCGISILPLLVPAFFIHRKRGVILADEPAAQLTLGLAASLATPLMASLSLLGAGLKPVIGWGTIWQLIVMGAAGAVLTPVWFALFARFNRAFAYQPAGGMAFRPDREIKRGRS